jgi:hypothetical protein
VSAVLSALIALLVAQPAQLRVEIRNFASERDTVEIAEQATHALLRQLGSRPDLIAISEPVGATQSTADLLVDGGIKKIGSLYLAVVVASDPKTGRPKTGESCRSANENALLSCLLEAAQRSVRAPDPIPVGRAGGSIAVHTLDAYDVNESVARNVTGVLRLELQKVGGLKVVAERGDWEVKGTVGRLEGTWIIDLQLLDPDEQIAHRVSEVFGGPQVELIQAMQVAARRLVGMGDDEKGDVAVIANVDQARISIDGAPAQPYAREQKLSLGAGKHHLELTAEDHHPVAREFYVLPGQTTTLKTSLLEIPDPWYQRWWVWTALGAAVVLSATVVGVAAANQPEEALIQVRIR